MFDGTVDRQGELGTPEFRLHFKNSFGKAISPWHDIRLQTAQYGILNAVIEIPKMTTAKMEVATNEENNPIAQDMKKGKVRNYHGPIFWNYGLLPQTWEDPNVEDVDTRCKGDNDPLDVVEIGSATLPTGAVVPVKPLGALAMIDEGELDWKIIALSVADPLANEIHDLEHLEAMCPEVISGIREWFRWYKTPDGKPLNSFGFEGRALPRAKANEVISVAFDHWRELRFGKAKHSGLWTKKVSTWTDGL
jgi:inorganic pyrophosphatase